jgi:hypothetical protein
VPCGSLAGILVQVSNGFSSRNCHVLADVLQNCHQQRTLPDIASRAALFVSLGATDRKAHARQSTLDTQSIFLGKSILTCWNVGADH